MPNVAMKRAQVLTFASNDLHQQRGEIDAESKQWLSPVSRRIGYEVNGISVLFQVED